MLFKKSLGWPLLIALEVLLVTLYAVSVHVNGGYPFHWVDVNGFRTLPSWLQFIQLFSVGALSLWMCGTYQYPRLPPSRKFLGFIALLFLYASADEILKLNILFGQHRLWQMIYLTLGLAVPVLFHRDLQRLWQAHHSAMRSIAIGSLFFFAGGFGLELFRVYVQQPHWSALFGRWEFYQVDSIRTAVEELGEMVGTTLVLKGLIAMAQERWAAIVRYRDGRQELPFTP
jgi:hypothetical protein